MTTQRRFLLRTSRRTLLILILAAAIVTALAGAAWAASGTVTLRWSSLLSLSSADATATPTRTPRPETVTPPLVPVELAIVLVTATSEPTVRVATPAPPVATPEPLTSYLIDVVRRYGMDMTRRFIVVDLASQTMTLWDPGHPTRIIPVSTGDETRGYRTLAWYGLVGDYWGTFRASDVYADEGWYLFEDAGHILIHGSPYKRADGHKVYEDMEALGTYPASKGCIRLAPDDAVWFTEWNPKGVPIVILPKSESLGIN
jgi:lipoprotein-anchoring transpeptidase ErfK/SrfK